MVKTHRDKFLEKHSLNKDASYSLEQLSELSNVPLGILQEVYNRGIGAYKTNLQSVRLKDSFVKNVKAPKGAKLSKEQWAMARVYSFLDGNKKHDNDLRNTGTITNLTNSQMSKGGMRHEEREARIDRLLLQMNQIRGEIQDVDTRMYQLQDDAQRFRQNMEGFEGDRELMAQFRREYNDIREQSLRLNQRREELYDALIRINNAIAVAQAFKTRDRCIAEGSCRDSAKMTGSAILRKEAKVYEIVDNRGRVVFRTESQAEAVKALNEQIMRERSGIEALPEFSGSIVPQAEDIVRPAPKKPEAKKPAPKPAFRKLIFEEEDEGGKMPKGNKKAGFIGLMVAKTHLKRSMEDYEKATMKKTPASFKLSKVKEPSLYLKKAYGVKIRPLSKEQRQQLIARANMGDAGAIHELQKIREAEAERQRKSRANRKMSGKGHGLTGSQNSHLKKVLDAYGEAIDVNELLELANSKAKKPEQRIESAEQIIQYVEHKIGSPDNTAWRLIDGHIIKYTAPPRRGYGMKGGISTERLRQLYGNIPFTLEEKRNQLAQLERDILELTSHVRYGTNQPEYEQWRAQLADATARQSRLQSDIQFLERRYEQMRRLREGTPSSGSGMKGKGAFTDYLDEKIRIALNRALERLSDERYVEFATRINQERKAIKQRLKETMPTFMGFNRVRYTDILNIPDSALSHLADYQRDDIRKKQQILADGLNHLARIYDEFMAQPRLQIKVRQGIPAQIPEGAEAQITFDEIKDGENMVDFHGHYAMGHLFQLSILEKLPRDAEGYPIDPLTREPIKEIIGYKAKIVKPSEGKGMPKRWLNKVMKNKRLTGKGKPTPEEIEKMLKDIADADMTKDKSVPFKLWERIFGDTENPMEGKLFDWEATENGMCNRCGACYTAEQIEGIRKASKEALGETSGLDASIAEFTRFQCPNCRENWSEKPPFMFSIPKSVQSKLNRSFIFVSGLASQSSTPVASPKPSGKGMRGGAKEYEYKSPTGYWRMGDGSVMTNEQVRELQDMLKTESEKEKKGARTSKPTEYYKMWAKNWYKQVTPAPMEAKPTMKPSEKKPSGTKWLTQRVRELVMSGMNQVEAEKQAFAEFSKMASKFS